ncbi:hypothetical protein DLREEDagrD3_01980 [Denitratisoma sp. agr-D3]
MAKRNPRTSAARLLTGLLLLCSAAAWGAGAGVVTHLSGTLSVKRADGSSKLLSVKSEVQSGDLLTTEQETYARIKFVDGGEVVLRPGSQLKVEAYAYDEAKPAADSSVLNLVKGGLRAVTGAIGKRNKDNVTFTTPTATIGIRGTHFGALLCQNDCAGVPMPGGQAPANGLHVDVTSGAVVVTNTAGQILVNPGQFGFVPTPTAPPVLVPPQQAVQPIPLPPSIRQNNGNGQGVGKNGGSECTF